MTGCGKNNWVVFSDLNLPIKSPSGAYFNVEISGDNDAQIEIATHIETDNKLTRQNLEQTMIRIKQIALVPWERSFGLNHQEIFYLYICRVKGDAPLEIKFYRGNEIFRKTILQAGSKDILISYTPPQSAITF